jgi:hypothetical protein
MIFFAGMFTQTLTVAAARFSVFHEQMQLIIFEADTLLWSKRARRVRQVMRFPQLHILFGLRCIPQPDERLLVNRLAYLPVNAAQPEHCLTRFEQAEAKIRVCGV